MRVPMRATAVALLAGLGFAITACGAAKAPAAQPHPAAASAAVTSTAAAPNQPAHPKSAKAGSASLVPLKFSFDFIPDGDQSPFYSAVARGFYKAQGLKVTLIKGVNTTDTLQWVASDKVPIVYDASGPTAKLITSGAPVTVVGVYFQKNPFGLVYKASAPLTKPTDVYGKSVSIPPGTDVASYWNAFVAANHLNLHRVKIVNGSTTANPGLLGQGKVAAFGGASYVYLPLLQHIGMPAGFMPFHRFGVAGMAECIVVNNGFLAKHPGVVRKFLYATDQGFTYAMAHPDQAASYLVKVFPRLNLKMAQQQLKLSLGFLHSRYTKGKVPGWQSSKDWQAQLSFLVHYEGMSKPKPLSRYYTNRYLPAVQPKAG